MTLTLENISFSGKDTLYRAWNYLAKIDHMFFEMIEYSVQFLEMKNYLINPKNSADITTIINTQKAVETQIKQLQYLSKHINKYASLSSHVKKTFQTATENISEIIHGLLAINIQEKIKNSVQIIQTSNDAREVELLRTYIALMQNNPNDVETKIRLEKLLSEHYRIKNQETVKELITIRNILTNINENLLKMLDERRNFLIQHEKAFYSIYTSQQNELSILFKQKQQSKFVIRIKNIFSKNLNQLIEKEKILISEFFEVFNKNSNEIQNFVKNIHLIEIYKQFENLSIKGSIAIGMIPLGPGEIIAAPLWLITLITKTIDYTFLEGTKAFKDFLRARNHEVHSLPTKLFMQTEMNAFGLI